MKWKSGNYKRIPLSPGDGGSLRKTNTHHTLPKSRKRNNVTRRLYVSLHDAFHAIFANGTIDEQLEQLMLINSPGISEHLKEDIRKILENSEFEYYYEKGLYKPK